MASAAAESAGSVAPDSGRRRGEGTPEPPPPPTPHPQPKMSPRTPDRASPYQKVGACFTCRQEGHWSRDCPSKKSAGGTQLGAGGGAVEAPECTCRAGPCLVLTSKTEKNPGRKFFRCPVMPCDEKCNFFQWCDSPSPHQPYVSSPVQQRLNLGSPVQRQAGDTLQQGDLHPLCECGAGWCIVLTMKEGEDAGRKYFSCPRKKSDEQCDFRQWCDESNLTGKCMTRPIHQDLVSPPHGTANIRYPNCACGAGRCRLLTKELGENAGQKYFACPVKKGQGACNFIQWQNPVEPRDAKPLDVEPTLLNFDDIEVRESNTGSVKPHPPSPFEPQGDADQSYQPSAHNSSPNVSLRPGKCYRYGKEGHWKADC